MRKSHRNYLARLERVKTALLRGFSDEEICVAEGISRRTLSRYKNALYKKGLKAFPKRSDEQKVLFVKHIERWEDVIRQAYRRLMSSEVIEGKISAAPLLRVISLANEKILDQYIKVGLIPKVEKLINEKKVIVKLWDESLKD